MSSYQPGGTLSAFLAPNLDMPHPGDTPELFYEIMNERERDTASVVNVKETGIYELEQQLTSQTWFAPAGERATQTRDTFRMVVNFGALPNNTSKSVPHTINVTSSTSFTKMYAVATNPSATGTTPFAFPIPGTDPTDLTKPVMVWVTTSNVVIKSSSNLSAYTTCYVVLEYLQN